MSHHLCGQPRRWITSAGLSPVALAPMGGHQMTPNINVLVSIVMSCFAQTLRAVERIIQRGVLFGWERSMTKAEQFREYAEEAMQWSRQSRTEEARNVLIDLALTWTRASVVSEGGRLPIGQGNLAPKTGCRPIPRS
jgi:hypothetical protein